MNTHCIHYVWSIAKSGGYFNGLQSETRRCLILVLLILCHWMQSVLQLNAKRICQGENGLYLAQNSVTTFKRWAIFNHLFRLYPIHLVLELISWRVHWNVNTIVQTCTHWDWKLCKIPFWLLTTSFLNTNYLLQTLNILNAYEFYLNVIECVVGEQTHIFCIPFMRMDWQVFVLIKRRFANATHSSNIHSNSYHNFLVLCAFLFKLRVQNKIIVAHGHFKKLFNKRMELAHTLIRWL